MIKSKTPITHVHLQYPDITLAISINVAMQLRSMMDGQTDRQVARKVSAVNISFCPQQTNYICLI